ncbi:transmembrane protein 179B [Rhineura floridana]|uniref:transmembrane protein 179B n=1 Tax=Rhineura floridana TaxID=261503 RepID=UPI002AC85FEA|nr:transmembrane protein 179B [Rhineura floridana]
MAQLSGLGLVELALNAAAFLCGVICASALAVTQGEFGGQCILYGSVLYNGTLSLATSSHVSLCYFVSGVSLLAAIFSFVYLLHSIYTSCFGDGNRWPDHVWIKRLLVFSAGVLFFLLISTCVLRVGMDTLCGSIQSSTAATSCQEAQHLPWVHPYRAKRFYDSLYTAEAAAWVNFFFWCLTVVLRCLESTGKFPFQPPQSSDLTWADERVPIFGDGPHRP